MKNITRTVTYTPTPTRAAIQVVPSFLSERKNIPNGTEVATVVASDPDTRQATSYAITGGNTGGAFAINSSSGEINTEVADPLAVIDHVAREYADADQDRLDGLTVDYGDWWFNLRPSNTEPLLRLNLEAATSEEVDARVAEVRSRLTV